MQSCYGKLANIILLVMTFKVRDQFEGLYVHVK